MITLVRVSAAVLTGSMLFSASACGGATASPVASQGPAASEAAAPSAAPSEPPPDGPPKDVDCGDFTTCAIAADGLARCWGSDKSGELGDGASGAGRTKRGVVQGVGKVTRVALASRFGCALLANKTVKCWGTGRIANDGKTVTDAKPTLVAGVEEAEELVASGTLACARGASGVVCWGAEEKTIGAPPKGKFKQLAVGFTHACALDEKGAVTCWGQGDWGGRGLYAKPNISGARQVVSGDRHACVLTKDAAVQCWGMNDAGQLGIKSDVEPHKKLTPVPGVKGVVRLAVGEASTCALLGDGSVRCWGANGDGELGLGTRTSDERPAQIPALVDVAQICLGSAHACALTKQSKLLCWGSNAFGQIGDGTKERRPVPTPVVW